MKVIIIEGMDNTGKDTLIAGLKKNLNVVRVIHCEKPEGNTPEECADFQNKDFMEKVNFCIDIKNQVPEDAVIIFNRAWQGEMVYGQIYRGRTEESIARMYNKLETKLYSRFDEKEVFYIQLMNTSNELLVNNEDGLSLSNANEEKINQERTYFYKAFSTSTIIDKHIIEVNDGNCFRPQADILDEVLDKINMPQDTYAFYLDENEIIMN